MSSNGLLSIIKKAAKEAVEASNPMGILYGTVISASPLKIQIEQKLTLTKEFLLLSKNVINYSTSVTVNHSTENTSQAIKSTTYTHNHNITGTKNITVNNGLEINDKVILIKIQGGQKYIVLDKVY